MAKMRLVSVIIAVYNGARFLPDALDSVMAQSHPVEVILVDDGSTDEIDRAIWPYRSRIDVIRQANLGLSSARNTGLARARGEYVLFLDADDILGQEIVAAQVLAAEHGEGVGVPVCRSLFFSQLDNSGRPVPCGEWRRFPSRLDIHLCHFNVAPPLAFLVRRDVALAAGGFDPGLKACEDYDFWLKAQCLGHHPVQGAAGVVWYRRHAGSMSTNLARQRLHDRELHLRVAQLIKENARGFGDDTATRLFACSAGMFLTAGRLTGSEFEPLLPVLRDLLARAGTMKPEPNELYTYFLARCLMLSRGSQLDARFPDLRTSVTACIENAGCKQWLSLDYGHFEQQVVSMGEALYQPG
jgi:glycosyltransferase involved in cell wall biosynthesis